MSVDIDCMLLTMRYKNQSIRGACNQFEPSDLACNCLWSCTISWM